MFGLSQDTFASRVLSTGFQNFDGGERQRITFDRCQFIKNTWSPAYDVPGAIIDVAHGHDDIVINECLIVGNSIGVPEDTIVRTAILVCWLALPNSFQASLVSINNKSTLVIKNSCFISNELTGTSYIRLDRKEDLIEASNNYVYPLRTECGFININSGTICMNADAKSCENQRYLSTNGGGDNA